MNARFSNSERSRIWQEVNSDVPPISGSYALYVTIYNVP